MGLKGHPMTVTYEYNSESWGVTAISQYGFRVDGRVCLNIVKPLSIMVQVDLMLLSLNMMVIQIL